MTRMVRDSSCTRGELVTCEWYGGVEETAFGKPSASEWVDKRPSSEISMRFLSLTEELFMDTDAKTQGHVALLGAGSLR